MALRDIWPNKGAAPNYDAYMEFSDTVEQAIDDNVVGGTIDEDGHLLLEQRDGSFADAGALPPGPEGPTGAPGGSDESFAEFVSDPETLTAAAVSAKIDETVAAEVPPLVAGELAAPGAVRDAADARVVAIGDARFATSNEVDAAYTVATRGFTHNRSPVDKMLGYFGTTGHAFTSNTMASNGTVNLNDTSQPMLGTQSVSVTYGTNGTGSGAAISKSTFTPFSVVDKYVRITFRHTGTIGGFVIYMASDTGYVNRYQTSFYSPAAHPPDLDQTIDIPFSHFTAAGSPDPNAIVALRVIIAPSPGNTGAGWVGQVALVDAPTTVIPNGAAILSFDDTFIEAYSIARPKMAQYGFAGTLYPIQSALTTDYNPALHYSVTQAQYMQDVHGWDVGYHATNPAMHSRGVSPGVSEADIRAEMEAIIAFNKAQNFRGDSFAYPNTASDTLSRRVVADYCRSARGGGAIFTETHPATAPMNLRAKNAGGLTLAQMKTFVDQAKAGKSIAHLFFHGLPVTKVGANDVARQDFLDLVDYIAAQGVPVLTVSQAASLPTAA